MSRTASTVPLRVGAHVIELPAAALVGVTIRRRLPAAPILRADTREVVGNSGTPWEEVVLQDPAACWTPLELDPDGEGPDAPHSTTICPECLPSWACDWQLELVLPVDGSGEA